MNIISLVEKFKIPLIIVGILILVITIQVRSCFNENRIANTSELEGRLQALTEETQKEKEESQKVIQKLEEKIAKKDEANAELRQENLDLYSEVDTLQEKDKVYEERIAELEKLEAQGDLKQMYENMTAQRDEWRDRFFNERAEKEKVIEQRDNFAEAYSNEHQKYIMATEQRDEYKAQLERQETLNKVSEEVYKEVKKENKRLKMGRKIERVFTWPTAAYGIFRFVQGVFFK